MFNAKNTKKPQLALELGMRQESGPYAAQNIRGGQANFSRLICVHFLFCWNLFVSYMSNNHWPSNISEVKSGGVSIPWR